jgi:ABC-type Mn2+/Zn2+ transport system permease subunit
MLSFELSAFDVILAIGVTILLIFQARNNKNGNSNRMETTATSTVKRYFRRLLSNIWLFPIVFGLIVMAWVGWLIWYDMTTWGKDIASIFFSARTGEACSLGIGMKIFDYFLIGVASPLLGLLIVLRRRILFARAQQDSVKKSSVNRDAF